MTTYSDAARRIIDGKNFCHVATIMRDGAPHVVPVWAHTDGEHLVVNSALGRIWPSNLERDGRVACTIINHDQPYEYVEVRGTVESMTTDDGDEWIDRLAKKYLDADTYPYRTPEEQRVTIRIAPERIKHHGG